MDENDIKSEKLENSLISLASSAMVWRKKEEAASRARRLFLEGGLSAGELDAALDLEKVSLAHLKTRAAEFGDLLEF